MISEDVIPAVEELVPFSWHGHEAAIAAIRGLSDRYRQVVITVMDADLERFVYIVIQSPVSECQAFTPTWLAVLGSVTLDGESLSFEDVAVVYEQLVAE